MSVWMCVVSYVELCLPELVVRALLVRVVMMMWSSFFRLESLRRVLILLRVPSSVYVGCRMNFALLVNFSSSE